MLTVTGQSFRITQLPSQASLSTLTSIADPVIAFAVGAIPEQVDDGKSGYLVTAGDNKKFADKLKDAAKLSLDEYDVMSQYAYQYGCKKYATSGSVERFVELLEV